MDDTVWNTSATELASLGNSNITEVENAFNVQPGDVIYFKEGLFAHIAVIYEVRKKEVI